MTARAYAPEIHRLAPETTPRRLGRFTWRRLAVYYAAVSVVLWGTSWLAARVGAVDAGMAPLGSQLSPRWLADALTPALVTQSRALIAAVAAMVSAFLLAVPVAWVYVRTRTSRKYDRSLVPTVIVLPVIVTGIVAVVRDNLALAFSLTGIVAAIRFRNTLKESNDAVYIFGAVAIGFAAGIQAFGIAAALSLLLTSLELALWRFDVGGEFAETFTRFCGERCAERPAAPTDSRAASAARLAAAAAPAPSASTAVVRAAPPPAAVDEGRLRLRVRHAPGLRRDVQRVLDRHAKRWELAARRSSRDGEVRELEYAVRLRRRSRPESLHAALRGAVGEGLLAAEWRMSGQARA